MTPKVNGNGGNDKNAMDAIKAYLEALKTKGAGKTEKTNDAAATFTPQHVQKTLTDTELLTAGTFIPGLEISTTARAEARRNADLEALPQTQHVSGRVNEEQVLASVEMIEELPISEEQKLSIGLGAYYAMFNKPEYNHEANKKHVNDFFGSTFDNKLEELLG